MIRVLFISLMFASSLFARNWDDYWTEAVERCHQEEYAKAESLFNLAINELEKGNPALHAHVYVDRARLYSLLDRDCEALADVDKALSFSSLEGEDQLRAVVTRVTTLYRLGRYDEAKLENEKLKAIYPAPKLELTEDKVIIRNMPDCEWSHQFFKSFLGRSFCESEDDVRIINGICIGKRKKCSCSEKDTKSSLEQELPLFQQHEQSMKPCLEQAFPTLLQHGQSKKQAKEAIEDCCHWCDKIFLAAQTFCAQTFKKYRCQVACLLAIDSLKDGCYWCCKTGDFYETCVKPFEDILAYMGKGCDPAWD